MLHPRQRNRHLLGFRLRRTTGLRQLQQHRRRRDPRHQPGQRRHRRSARRPSGSGHHRGRCPHVRPPRQRQGHLLGRRHVRAPRLRQHRQHRRLRRHHPRHQPGQRWHRGHAGQSRRRRHQCRGAPHLRDPRQRHRCVLGRRWRRQARVRQHLQHRRRPWRDAGQQRGERRHRCAAGWPRRHRGRGGRRAHLRAADIGRRHLLGQRRQWSPRLRQSQQHRPRTGQHARHEPGNRWHRPTSRRSPRSGHRGRRGAHVRHSPGRHRQLLGGWGAGPERPRLQRDHRRRRDPGGRLDRRSFWSPDSDLGGLTPHVRHDGRLRRQLLGFQRVRPARLRQHQHHRRQRKPDQQSGQCGCRAAARQQHRVGHRRRHQPLVRDARQWRAHLLGRRRQRAVGAGLDCHVG